MTSFQESELFTQFRKMHERAVKEDCMFMPTITPLHFGFLLDRIEALEQDAARYNALIASDNYSPSVWNSGWGLRTGGRPATKAELNAAADALIAQQDKGKETV